MEARRQQAVKRTTISANHASREFLHKLNELRWSRSLVDVVIVGDEEEEGKSEEILAHKLLLCGCSPYFNTLFASHWASDTANQGELEKHKVAGVSTNNLRALVDFMYHGEIEITEDNAADILVAADMFLMKRLKDAICKFMQTIIYAANCVFFYKLADFYSCRLVRQGETTYSIPKLFTKKLRLIFHKTTLHMTYEE